MIHPPRSLAWALAASSLLLAWAASGAERKGFSVGPAPRWVTREAVDPAAPPPPGVSADGTAHLLMETQENPEEAATYFRFVRRFQGAAAVGAGSELTFSWDPTFQTFTLHEVVLHRGAVARNVLRPSAVRLLEREEDLESKLLDGRVSAMLVLEDVRPGDVLEFAYTRRGANPIFGGRWSSSFPTGSTVPCGRVRRRVLVGRGRTIAYRLLGGARAPEQRDGPAGRELVWDTRDVAATRIDGGLPVAFEALPRIQLSEWRSWSEVAAWGAMHFRPTPEDVPDEVVSRVRGREGRPDAEVAVDALRFVQDEVRYLGVEMGVSSHAPAAPATVLVRRFGDCKDKARLLVSLLRRLGLRADPALVSTARERGLAALLPAPDVFDHVVVRLEAGGATWWVDPTRRQRRGRLEDLSTPDLGKALVLDPASADLVDLPRTPARLARRVVKNVFVIPERGPAVYTVTTRHSGDDAESVREDWAGARPADLEKNYLGFYTRRYPGIRAASPPELKDDAPDGSVTIVERYLVDDFFRGNPPQAEIFPQELRERVVQIAQPGRSTPYALPFPSETEETFEIVFPHDWYLVPLSATLKNPWFDFSVRGERKPKSLVLTWRLAYRTDEVPAADVKRFAQDVRTLFDHLGYTIAWGGETHPRSGLGRVNWPVVASTALLLSILGFLAFHALTMAPPSPPRLPTAEESAYEGLGGWLVLVGFGLLVRPLYLVVSMVSDQGGLFDVASWEEFTAAGRPPAIGAYLLAELAVNLLLLTLGVACLVAFFRKKRVFVPLFAALLVLTPLLVGADVAVAPLFGAEASRKETIQVATLALSGLVWLLYLARSKRVRATFLN